MKAEAGETVGDVRSGSAGLVEGTSLHWEVEPWPEPVDGGRVLDELEGVLRRFVVLRGRAVTEAWLAQQLRPYGVRPRTLRMGEALARGYVEEEFREAFRRYIPRAEFENLRAELQAREK